MQLAIGAGLEVAARNRQCRFARVDAVKPADPGSNQAERIAMTAEHVFVDERGPTPLPAPGNESGLVSSTCAGTVSSGEVVEFGKTNRSRRQVPLSQRAGSHRRPAATTGHTTALPFSGTRRAEPDFDLPGLLRRV